MRSEFRDLGNKAEWKEGSIEQHLYERVIAAGYEFKPVSFGLETSYVCQEARVKYHE